MEIIYCSCHCGCNHKLLTFSSKCIGRCSDCRIGNCKGFGLIRTGLK